MTVKRLSWKRSGAVLALREPRFSNDWNRLNGMRCDLPFMDSRSMLAALDSFGTGSEQLLYATSGDETAAMFVVSPQGRLRYSTFQPSQIPLGAWVARPDLPLEDLADQAVRGPLGACLALSVTQVDPQMAPRPVDSPTRRCIDYIETGWIEISGTFDDYWAARGKNLRQNMRKQRNKLAAEGISTNMLVLRGPEQMAAALARYGHMEAAGWKASEGTAIEAGNAQGRFYRRLFEEAARAGEAFVTEYLFNDRTVAMNLSLLRNGLLVVLKTTYDESVIKAFSPAFLLREDELRLFHEGTEVRRLEFFGRMMEWHSRYTDLKRGIYHLTCYRWPWVRQLASRQPTIAQSEMPVRPAAKGAV